MNTTAKKRRVLTAVILCAALTLLLLSLSSCFLKKKPTATEYLFDAMSDTLEKRTGSPFPAFDKSGSAALTFRATPTLSGIGFPIDNFSVKQYYGKDSGMTEANLTVGGKTTDLRLWTSEKRLALSSSLLGTSAYSVDLTTLKDAYLDSIFSDPESPYSMVELFGEDGKYFESVKSAQALSEELTELLRKYEKLIQSILHEKAETSLTSEKGGKVVSLVIQNRSLKEIVRELYAEAKKDDELRSMLVKILERSRLAAETGSAEDITEILRKYDEFFASEEGLNKLLEQLDQLPFRFSVTAHTDKKNLIRSAEISIGTSSPSGSDMAAVILSADLTEENRAVFTLRMEGEDVPPMMESGFSIVLETSEQQADTETTTLCFSMSGVTMEIMRLDYNRSTGDYTLVLRLGKLSEIGGGSLGIDDLSIGGVCKTDKSSFSLTVTSFKAGETEGKLDITLTILAKDKMPSLPSDSVEFFKMNEEELTNLIEKIKVSVQQSGLLDLFGEAGQTSPTITCINPSVFR